MKILIDFEGNIYKFNYLNYKNKIKGYNQKYIPIKELIETNTVDKIENFKDINLNIENSSCYKTFIYFDYNNFKYSFYLKQKEYLFINEQKISLVNVIYLDADNNYKFKKINDSLLLENLINEFQRLLKIKNIDKNEEKIKNIKLNILDNYIEYYLSDRNQCCNIFNLFKDTNKIQPQKLKNTH